MSELEAVAITNPTEKDFTWQYNGEPYTIPSGETKAFAKNVSFHLAYHLSRRMLEDGFVFSKKKNLTEQERNKEATKFSQLLLYDNPNRRTALFKILRDTSLVQACLMKYPISMRGFIEGGHMGTMDEYTKFVLKEGGTFASKTEDEPTIHSLQAELKELREQLKKEKEEPVKKPGRPSKVENTNI